MKITLASALLVSGLCSASVAQAHGGGLDRNGCHHDRQNGGYHCHQNDTRPPQRSDQSKSDQNELKPVATAEGVEKTREPSSK